jgi:hypothetical protein
MKVAQESAGQDRNSDGENDTHHRPKATQEDLLVTMKEDSRENLITVEGYAGLLYLLKSMSNVN